jgi:hypothetical protein
MVLAIPAPGTIYSTSYGSAELFARYYVSDVTRVLSGFTLPGAFEASDLTSTGVEFYLLQIQYPPGA